MEGPLPSIPIDMSMIAKSGADGVGDVHKQAAKTIFRAGIIRMQQHASTPVLRVSPAVAFKRGDTDEILQRQSEVGPLMCLGNGN